MRLERGGSQPAGKSPGTWSRRTRAENTQLPSLAAEGGASAPRPAHAGRATPPSGPANAALLGQARPSAPLSVPGCRLLSAGRRVVATRGKVTVPWSSGALGSPSADAFRGDGLRRQKWTRRPRGDARGWPCRALGLRLAGTLYGTERARRGVGVPRAQRAAWSARAEGHRAQGFCSVPGGGWAGRSWAVIGELLPQAQGDPW